ncbi:S16 family serine protease [Paenibacillus aceris]|uniref:PDZ domain-containing protein n=1 Tax=Paenibacillus aceris TaxID=869555 RepID=A0ABS4I064_9BACL|nr:S16 family serine protease [Paenibacillus aceris]MBP1964200.1 PDZ domain-containing protein [Paenibacillus aceris]NHW36528.1 hypothetical protein [Paenibacillus aceris]
MRIVIRIKKELLVGILLLIIPFTVSFIFVLPSYNYFVTAGDVVPVSQLGIKGHVYFAFVKSGYTKNLYEKYALMIFQKNSVTFETVDQEEVDLQKEELEYEAGLRKETIQSAVTAVSTNLLHQDLPTSGKMNEIIKNSERYYGDSFGLMVAIGLTEEWGNEDFSKNGRLKIAGTGTINDTMKVGPVGGIRYKLISAERKGMQYFFVPQSIVKAETGLSNKEEAFQVKKEKNMKIQIVPVDSLEEAVAYLRKLP